MKTDKTSVAPAQPVDSDKREQTGHTPTPWTLHFNMTTQTWSIGNGINICTIANTNTGNPHQSESLANADFIVRAANSHSALLEAAKLVSRTLPASPVHYSDARLAKVVRAAIQQAEQPH